MKPKRPVRPVMSDFTDNNNNINKNTTPSYQSNGNNETSSSTKENSVTNPFGNKSSTKSPFAKSNQENVYENTTPSSTKNSQKPSSMRPVNNQSQDNFKTQEINSDVRNESSTNSTREHQQQQQNQQKKRGNAYTMSETSQAHKRNPKNYKINPKVVPRPNHFDEIYKNPDDQPIYNTNEDNLPPYSNTHFFVNETGNSTPRIIRSTLNRIPSDLTFIQNTNLMFGFVMQPFAEFLSNEKEIPKVEVTEGIFRCKRCEGYINNKWKIDFNKNNKRIAVCNLCDYQNELDTTNPKVKSEYFNSSIPVPELSTPTVDFMVPNNMKHQVDFVPHYIFMIDVSSISSEAGLPNYVRLCLFLDS